MTTPRVTVPTGEAAARVRSYLARHAQNRSGDPRSIHGYDIGEPSEAELLVDDLHALSAAPDALRVAVEALEKASRAISAQYALAQAEYQHLDTVATKHDKIVQEGRRAIREALAALQAEQGAK